MIKPRLVLACCLVLALGVGTASAATIPLSFTGSVDVSGATIGGVSAPLGTPFTLDVGIDDSTAAIGRYSIDSISYTLTIGTYTTTTDWSATELVATQVGPSITLESDPFFSSPGESFLLTLSGFGPASFDDPYTWDVPGGGLTGDIIVRGIGGFASPDQLSGIQPYTGTLALNTPEPGTLCLLGVGILGLALGRRRRK